jgi:CheY-like chemotaxis protein
MDAASAARAFEPFFTTKDVGKGTGLGLSQVYGFLRQAGGFCTLSSSPGRGCVVDLYLPRSLDPAPTLLRPSLVVPLQRAERGEVVLIVEDEKAVLDMTAENLSGLGYGVLCAPDARVALKILHGPDRVDILFSDVVMPGGMNGAQLANKARIIRPLLKVLLTSGYTETAGEGVRELPPGVQLRRKPYLSEDLSRELRL